MKKLLLISVFILMKVMVFSQKINIDITYFTNIYNKELILYYLSENKFAVITTGDREDFVKRGLVLQYSYDVKKELHGHFVRNSLAKGSAYGIDEIEYYIEGKGIIIPITVSSKYILLMPNQMLRDIKDNKSFDYKKWQEYKKQSEKLYIETYRESARVTNYDSGITSIKASSFLSENTRNGFVEYLADNILEKIYYMDIDDYDKTLYDSLTPPWVEGVKGYGIGEYLDMEFKWKSDEMQILNGFVDFTRMDLYEKNSRVKTVLIESENPKFAQEYELDDIVRYTVVKLPAKTDKIRMTIKDVYKGSKYDDTCISSILVTNPNLPSYEEMEEKILKAIEKSGIKLQ
ncbi:hypothetical protein HRQ91_11215 [Treponema parvum]|uniref:NAD glycohydrolase translocation F5/8 type C domain-containing protein n=1 Tax=Treponema parvum TaxID=138851 RepID=A0A975IFJ3_9SPIR|nr:hypothetical protein [Treponema parvum]QTQ14983.1 hypothetical protein HRQ91_11215 [Treponema parvum]